MKTTRYDLRLKEAELSHYEVVEFFGTVKGVSRATIKCKECGHTEENIDINSKIRYKKKCGCQTAKPCECCGELIISQNANGRARTYCEKCNPYDPKLEPALFTAKHRELNTNRLKEEFGESCVFCGYNKHYSALEFHHLDSNTKDFNPKSKLNSKYEEVKKECDKCILICANCHRLIHNGIINNNGEEI